MGKVDTSRGFDHYIVYGRDKLSIKVSATHPSSWSIGSLPFPDSPRSQRDTAAETELLDGVARRT
jgi:hypothetical protein